MEGVTLFLAKQSVITSSFNQGVLLRRSKMLTIFSCPKPFKSSINIIQRNAIISWMLLQPRPEIILIGAEEGVAEVCREFGLRHILEVQRNECGIPLVSAIFGIGQSIASNPYVCYVNADIILLNCFMEAAQRTIRLMGENYFLAIGRRWDVPINKLLDFKDADWQSKWRSYLKTHEKLGLPTGIDYFLFLKGLWKSIPPFVLGRCYWDNWLVYNAYSRGIRIIDITPVTTVIHQSHDYSHIPGGTEGLKKGIDMKHNWQLQGSSYSQIFNVWDSTHILSRNLKRSGPLRRLAANLFRLRKFVAGEKLYPYSLPLIVTFRGSKNCFRSIQKLLKKVPVKPV